MPRMKPFSKKTATTYTLVHRPQHDPQIHDPEAPPQIFTQVSGPNASSSYPSTSKHKIQSRDQLEEALNSKGELIRENEGEAAEHGIFYDDSRYDYMQHLRDLGSSTSSSGERGTQAVWLAAAANEKSKGKQKQSLEDALLAHSIDDPSTSPSNENEISLAEPSLDYQFDRTAYQRQQDTPDAISGFQPFMDPRLREVLEALDDEEYVDDDEELFGELAGEGGGEIDEIEFEDQLYDEEEEDDDGWESDVTEKPSKELADDNSTTLKTVDGVIEKELDKEATNKTTSLSLEQTQEDNSPRPPDSIEDGDFLANFTKAKPATSSSTQNIPTQPQKPHPQAPSTILSTATNGLRKKRKGALTSGGYSMTSSSIPRTETMSILDSRFDKLAAEYMDELPEEEEDIDENISLVSGVSGITGITQGSTRSKANSLSKTGDFADVAGGEEEEVPELVQANFDRTLDEFLGVPDSASSSTTTGTGKNRGRIRMMRKGGGKQGVWGAQNGLDQLDEIRKGLGPARTNGLRRVQRA